MRIIDIHTHAFPDALAERAMRGLEEEGNTKAFLDGTVSSLLGSMDETGIEVSVLAQIATKPDQFDPILAWSQSVASERILPFPSVHHADDDVAGKVRRVADAGFKGIKLHPYYQNFDVDDTRLWPAYQAMAETGLLLLLHTGFDMAFERVRKADPVRVLKVIDAFPDLKLITTHFGAWEDWDEVEKHLLGKPIYTDVSYSIEFMEKPRARDLILAHPRDRVLFGTDSPWSSQRAMVDFVHSLGLGSEWEQSILFDNAARLLGID